MRAIIIRHGKVDFQWRKWSTSEQFNKDCKMYDEAASHCLDYNSKDMLNLSGCSRLLPYILFFLIPEKDSLKLVKSEAEKYYQSHSSDDCFCMGMQLYESDNFQSF